MKPVETMTDAEVREELAAKGIDLDAAKARFMPKLDDLMRARAVRLALAAVRDNQPDTESPLLWQQTDRRTVVDADGDFVARCATEADAAHIAAAVNAAPILAAEVERLRGLLAAARVAVEALPELHPERCVNGHQCHCGAVKANKARAEARAALGVGNGSES